MISDGFLDSNGAFDFRKDQDLHAVAANDAGAVRQAADASR